MDRQLTPRQVGAEELITREWFAGSEASSPIHTFEMMTSAYQSSVGTIEHFGNADAKVHISTRSTHAGFGSLFAKCPDPITSDFESISTCESDYGLGSRSV